MAVVILKPDCRALPSKETLPGYRPSRPFLEALECLEELGEISKP